MNDWNEAGMMANSSQVLQENNLQYNLAFTDQATKSNIAISEYCCKKQIDLNYQRIKKIDDIAYDQRLLENRYRHAQRVREGKLAHCEVVEINEKGDIQIVSKNLTIPTRPRLVANFKCEDVITYIRAESDEKIVQLLLKIDSAADKNESIFLALKELTKNRYIERKLLSVDATVYGSSEAKRKEYKKMIVEKLVSRSTKTIVVPMKRGWYRTADTIEFFDGEWTWEELAKNAE